MDKKVDLEMSYTQFRVKLKCHEARLNNLLINRKKVNILIFIYLLFSSSKEVRDQEMKDNPFEYLKNLKIVLS